MTIKVLITDDHETVRRGLTVFLRALSGFETVGEAGDGEEAVKKAALLKPDLVLMDISMPIMDGIEATQIIHRNHPTTKILILTSFSEEDHVRRALDAGASGYLQKGVSIAELNAELRKLFPEA
jgi:DNA-binding NarL/FixJ family response regulator